VIFQKPSLDVINSIFERDIRLRGIIGVNASKIWIKESKELATPPLYYVETLFEVKAISIILDIRKLNISIIKIKFY